MHRFVSRNKVTLITAIAVALVSSGTAVAASYLVLGTTTTASATTGLKSSVAGAVLQITNSNTAGSTSARGLSITVPSGRAPITVNSSAGKATNLNADKLDGIDSSGFVKGPVAAWREVGTAGQPGYDQQCSLSCWPEWENYHDSFSSAAFYKDPLGVVRLKGLIKYHGFAAVMTCDGTRIFTLPTGYRPGKIVIAPTMSNDHLTRLNIYPDGRIMLCAAGTLNDGDWFLLDGITFRAEQ
jgi:hypothetical protein